MIYVDHDIQDNLISKFVTKQAQDQDSYFTFPEVLQRLFVSKSMLRIIVIAKGYFTFSFPII